MALHFVFLGVLAYLVSSAKAGYIDIKTPKQANEANTQFTLISDNGNNVDFSCKTKSITFEVKACQDAWIGLMENEDTNTALYNVAIGGWNNHRTVLYRKKLERPHLIQYNGQLLNCDIFKEFNIKWANEQIELWRFVGGSRHKILSYPTPDTTRIRFIGVTTSKWANGEWKVFLTDDTSCGDMTTMVDMTTTDRVDETTTIGDVETTETIEEATPAVNETTMMTTPEVEMCPEPGVTNVSDTMTCTRVCQIETSLEQLMEEIKQMKEELTVNKESLSRQKNSLISADDKRPSAAVIGYVGLVIIASLLVGIILIDLPNLVRMVLLMHVNITSSSRMPGKVSNDM